jgi:hypothetical protein
MVECRPRVPRQKFSPEEDERLRELVSVHGEQNWHLISAELGNRRARPCKERWAHYLSPSVMHSAWAPHEDKLLEEKVNELGRRWKVLEAYFPGRTDVNLKNRYNLLTRKRNKAIRMALHLPLKVRSTKQIAFSDPRADTPDFDSQNEPKTWLWHFPFDLN